MDSGISDEREGTFEFLLDTAITLGATAVAIIPTSAIQVKDRLAALCNGEYVCPNYGLGLSCPPHVDGPDVFRAWQAESDYSLVVKIDLPTSVMFSSERTEVMKLLHQIVAEVERKAVTMGFEKSRGFAGGSCKELFCEDQLVCCVLEENKPCPHDSSARPSMSGFGVDATRLMQSCGWRSARADKSELSGTDDISWLTGFVMLA